MLFREALLRAIEGWNSDPIADEWLFEKFREEFVCSMPASNAFEAIDEAVEILLNEMDESTATEILQTIIGLARQSQTTEIPRSLQTKGADISAKFSAFGGYANDKLLELLRYYRV